MLTADCYIANNDDELIVLCESIQDDSSIRSIFMANSEETGVEDLTDSQVVIGIDGYKAWAVAKKIFGSDILGLPYLSIESYTFQDTDIRLIRAGKTSEFGYLLIAPKEIGPALYDALLDAVKEQGGGLCGADTHNNLRLEGRFFNIYSEGAAVLDPLPLGLQWMIDFDKEGYTGHDSIMERRKNGLEKKIIGINVAKGVSFEPGMAIYDGSKKVAEVKSCCFSYILDSILGLALFDIEDAFSGLTFNLNSPDGPQVKTVSMPPIIPKSLTVKLDEI
jgi:aminomethyltransferase